MSGEYSNLNRRLSDLSTETTAQAIILLRRKQLIASTGNLSAPAIQELVEIINSSGSISSQNITTSAASRPSKPGIGDLVRFVKLQAIQERLFVYAISLSRELSLALVFDQDTKFSSVRKQTQLIRKALLAPEPTAPLDYRSSASGWMDQPIASPHQPVTGDVSHPAPGARTPEHPGFDEPKKPTPRHGDLYSFVPTPSDFSANEAVASPSPAPESQDAGTSNPTPSSVPGEDAASYHDFSEVNEQAVPPQTDPGSSADQVENPDPSDFPLTPYITYSCLLIPRMPQHLLTSNLSSYLFTWMGQLCLAYGWRLEHLSIQSGHIQWIAGAPLSTSPAFIVRTLRQKTSQYIFAQYPPLAKDNPSGEFWAPGFYLSGGKQSFQAHQIDRIINEIREQQGVYNSSLY